MKIVSILKNILANPIVFSMFNFLIGVKHSNDIFINTYVKPKANSRVIDIGCGNGSLTHYFKDTNYKGFDISEFYIEDAKRSNPWANFECVDICKNPLPESSADIAIISGLLHHLNDDQCAVLLKNLAIALKPGGQLIARENCYIESQNSFAKWMMDNDRGEHVRWRDAYENLLKVNFKIEECIIRQDLLNIPYTHIIFRVTPL